MPVTLKTCLMACHMHVCGVQISEKEKWSVFNPREEQELSLKSASALLLLLSDIFFSVLETPKESGQGQQFISQQGGRVWQCQRAHIFQHITGYSLISRQDCVTTARVCTVCQQWNLKHTRVVFTGIRVQPQTVQRFKLQYKWHQKI